MVGQGKGDDVPYLSATFARLRIHAREGLDLGNFVSPIENPDNRSGIWTALAHNPKRPPGGGPRPGPPLGARRLSPRAVRPLTAGVGAIHGVRPEARLASR